MTAVLLSALVVAAVAGFLVWWVRYRAERIQADADIHAQLTAVRAALRAHGIDVHEPDTKPRPAPAPTPRAGGAPRHAKREAAA